MRNAKEITEVLVYWDSQDSSNEGWAERVTYSDGHQESGPCDQIDSEQGLDAIPDAVLGVAFSRGLQISSDAVAVDRTEGGSGSWVR